MRFHVVCSVLGLKVGSVFQYLGLPDDGHVLKMSRGCTTLSSEDFGYFSSEIRDLFSLGLPPTKIVYVVSVRTVYILQC